MFGYRSSFLVTGAMMLAVFLLTLFFVHEEFAPVTKAEMVPTKQIFKQMAYPRLIWGLFITTMVIQAANMSITSFISLLVASMVKNQAKSPLRQGWCRAYQGS